MKRKTTFSIIFCICLFGQAFCQDVIIKNDKSEITCKIVEITESVIKYKNISNLDGPLRNVAISNIFMVIYENGERETFEVNQNNNDIKEESAFDNNKGVFIDVRDNQEYNWVKIGNQIWMAQNLNYITSNGSVCYENNEVNCTLYGRLYNWETASYSCPDGWHLPTNDEWKILIDFVGGKKISGQKLKETGNKHWDKSNQIVTNDYGFNALPGGEVNVFISLEGFFNGLTSSAYFYTATEYDASHVYIRSMHYNSRRIFSPSYHKASKFSVRCLKD